MKIRFLLVLAIVIGFVSAASAQTKASGTLQCAKPDPTQSIEIGDRPGHSMTVSKTACTWSKGMDIGGRRPRTEPAPRSAR